MKTEAEIVSHMEKVSQALTDMGDKLSPEERESPTVETAAQLSFLIGFLMGLGYAVGADDEILQVFSSWKVAGNLDKLKGLF